MAQLRRRYETAGLEHKRKLIDQAVQLPGCYRKAALAEADLTSCGLCLWAALDGDVAGADSSLRAAQADNPRGG